MKNWSLPVIKTLNPFHVTIRSLAVARLGGIRRCLVPRSWLVHRWSLCLAWQRSIIFLCLRMERSGNCLKIPFWRNSLIFLSFSKKRLSKIKGSVSVRRKLSNPTLSSEKVVKNLNYNRVSTDLQSDRESHLTLDWTISSTCSFGAVKLLKDHSTALDRTSVWGRSYYLLTVIGHTSNLIFHGRIVCFGGSYLR